MNIKRLHALLSLTLGPLAVAATLALLAAWGPASPAAQARALADIYDTYYVAPDCAGVPEPCQTTVQAAVDAADEPTDIVKVAAGIYTGVTRREDITQVVYISKTLTLMGGYTAAFIEPPDPAANLTILDAEGAGRVLYVTGDISPTLQGLGLTGGDATGLGGGRWPGEHAGGGVYLITATATLSDCWVYSNTARSGGGVFLQDSDATLSGNTIVSNSATTSAGGSYGDGGGLFLNNSSAGLSRNLIRYNTAGFSGSGLYLQSSDGVILINDVIADNQIAGLYSFDCGVYLGASSIHMLHTTIARNTGGGGTGVCVTTWPATSTTMLTNTIIVSQVVGIRAAGDSQARLASTLWHDNGDDWQGTVTDANGHAGDPAFAADGYHLTAGSAAIDQGGNAGVASDIDGQARPLGAGYDLGADEWDPYIYVDWTGVCNGLLPCHPTIGAAVATAGADAIIHVFPGTYAESVDLSTMGGPGNVRLITVDASDTPSPGTATVDPGAPGGPGTGSAFHNSVDPFPGDVTLDGFIVDSPDADGILLKVGSDVVVANVTANAVGDGNDVDLSGDDGVDIRAQTGDITLTHCTANGNFGTYGDGFDVQTAAGNLSIISCEANNNQGTDDNQGFEIEDVGGNLLVSDTVANRNRNDGFWTCCIDGDVVIDGSGAEDNGDFGFRFPDSRSMTIWNSSAIGNDADGFAIRASGGMTVAHSTALSNTCDGFLIYGVDRDLVVTNSVARGNRGDGFAITGTVDISVTGCAANRNWGDGFWANTTGDVTAVGFDSNNNDGDGFWVRTPGDVRLTGLSVLHNGWDGIWVHHAGGDVSIADSGVSYNEGHGVYACADGDITIAGTDANQNQNPTLDYGDGFELWGGGAVTVTQCGADDNYDDGIEISTIGSPAPEGFAADRDRDGGAHLDADESVVREAAATEGPRSSAADSHLDARQDVTVVKSVARGHGSGDGGTEDSRSLEIGNVDGSLLISDAGVNDSDVSLSIPSPDVTVISATADRNGEDGFDISGTRGDVRLEGCAVNQNGEDGIDISNTGGDVRIESCTADNTLTSDGFDIGQIAGTTTIRNTTATGNDDDGFDIWETTGVVRFEDCTANGNEDGFDVRDTVGDVEIEDCTANSNANETLHSDGFELEGLGGSAVITDATAVGNADDGFDIATTEAVVLYGLTADGNGDDGVYVDADGTVIVRDSTATNGLGGSAAGFYLQSRQDVTVVDCVGSGNGSGDGSDGFDIGPVGGTTTISNAIAIDNGDDGLDFWVMGDDVKLDNCTAHGSGDYGIIVGDVDGDVRIKDCTGTENKNDGIHAWEVIGTTEITNVTAVGNDQDGFGFWQTHGPVAITASMARDNTVSGVWFEWGGDIAFSGGIICDNGHGFFMDSWSNATVEAVWWGDSSGPSHPANPGGSGDSVKDGDNGASGWVDYTPWIDAISGNATVDPVLAGQPTIVSFQISDQAKALFLGPGPGDPNGPSPFTLTTDNGTITGTNEAGPQVHEFINQSNGVLTVTLVPDTGGTATVNLDGPCNLDDVLTVDVLACNAPQTITISGPATMSLDKRAPFTATVSPPDANLPITYTWEAAGQTVQMHPGAGISDTEAFTWFVLGPQVVTVTAANQCGSAGAAITVTVNNLPPLAEAGPHQQVEIGDIVTLDGSGSTDPDGHLPLAYCWAQAGGPVVALSSPAAVSPTFTAPGAPTVLTFTLTVTDAYGLASSPDTTIVTVTDEAIAGLTADNSSPTILGHTTFFTANLASGSNVSYHWAFGDGHAGTGRTVTHTYQADGVYTAVVTASNAADQLHTTTPVTITNRDPVASAGDDQSVTVDATVTLNGSGSYDPDDHLPLAYGWAQAGDPVVALSSPAAVSPTFTAPGAPAVLTFTLTVTDAYGLASSPDTTVVTVTDKAIAGLTADNSSPTTLGHTTFFTASVTAGSNVSYHWAFGDGQTGTGQSITHTYDAAITYTAAVTTSNAAGKVSATTHVTVTNEPPIADAGSNQQVQVGDSVTLDGSGSYDPDGHLPLTYGWAQTGGPGVTLSDAAAVSTTFTAPGKPTLLTFTLTVTDAYGMASPPAATVVTVGEIPITGLTADNSSPSILGHTTFFTADVASGSNIAYQWAFGDGHTGTGQTVSHTYSAAAIYTAVVTAANGIDVETTTTPVTITNQRPAAHAGDDQSVRVGETVTLNGSGSHDPDGHLPLSYGWLQTGGKPVTLTAPYTVSPTFTAPDTTTVLTFTLTVTDSYSLASTPASVVIFVESETHRIFLPITTRNLSPAANPESTRRRSRKPRLAAPARGSSLLAPAALSDHRAL